MSICKEQWRDINILGLLGVYQVSNLGKVKSLPRTMLRSNGRLHPVRERVLKPAKDANGYLRVGLTNHGKNTTYKVHRLVAESFCSKCLSDNEVNHINGVKDDNRSINLEWSNRSKNAQHSYDTGLQKPLRGEKNPTAKITEKQAIQIKKLISEKQMSLIEISKTLKISYYIIKDINRGRTWSHVGL